MIHSPGSWTLATDHQIRLNWSICNEMVIGHFTCSLLNKFAYLTSGHCFKCINDSNWSLDLRNMSLMPPGFETGSPWQIRISTWSDTCRRKVKSWQVDINVTQCHTSTVGHMANNEHGPGHCSLSKHNTKIFKIAGSFMLILVISIWVSHMLGFCWRRTGCSPRVSCCGVGVIAISAGEDNFTQFQSSESSCMRRLMNIALLSLRTKHRTWVVACFFRWIQCTSLGHSTCKNVMHEEKTVEHQAEDPSCQNTVPCLIQSLWRLPWHTTGNIFPISENPASLSS